MTQLSANERSPGANGSNVTSLTERGTMTGDGDSQTGAPRHHGQPPSRFMAPPDFYETIGRASIGDIAESLPDTVASLVTSRTSRFEVRGIRTTLDGKKVRLEPVAFDEMMFVDVDDLKTLQEGRCPDSVVVALKEMLTPKRFRRLSAA